MYCHSVGYGTANRMQPRTPSGTQRDSLPGGFPHNDHYAWQRGECSEREMSDSIYQGGARYPLWIFADNIVFNRNFRGDFNRANHVWRGRRNVRFLSLPPRNYFTIVTVNSLRRVRSVR